MIHFPDQHFGAYILSTEKTRIQLDVVHHFLDQESYWARDIALDVLKTAIQHSLCLGVYLPDGSQVAFGRLITDYATFGYLADIFVLPEHRGKAIAKEMMKYFCDIADQCGLRRLLLTTRDAHGLYGQYGFIALPHPESMMSRMGAAYPSI